MKTIPIFLLTALSAFGQGKVALVGDTLSHVVLPWDPLFVNPRDLALAGQPVGNTVLLPSGIVLIAGLWGGMTQGSMILQTTVLLNQQSIEAGWISQTRVTLRGIPGIASGTPIGASTPWFQVRVWDSAFGTDEAGYWAAWNNWAYVGYGSFFQMNPGSSIAYVLTAPPNVNSTWTEGNIGPLWRIPEPSALALLGLGSCALLFRKRRGAR